MVTMGVGIVGSTDWLRLRQGAADHGFSSWCHSWHCSVRCPRGAVHEVVLLSWVWSRNITGQGVIFVWLKPYSVVRFGYNILVMVDRPEVLFSNNLALTRTQCPKDLMIKRSEYTISIWTGGRIWGQNANELYIYQATNLAWIKAECMLKKLSSCAVTTEPVSGAFDRISFMVCISFGSAHSFQNGNFPCIHFHGLPSPALIPPVLL